MRHIILFLISILVAGTLVIGCTNDDKALPDGSSLTAPAVSAAKGVPDFPADPGGFVAEIDNPYLGFERGKTFRYEGETDEGLETIVVEVTARHQDDPRRGDHGRPRPGVPRRRAHRGHVRLVRPGRRTATSGTSARTPRRSSTAMVVSTEGSWEAGVDGAMPGVLMLAEPVVGVTYQQEFAEDVAEDMARVLSLKKSVEVPYGAFDECLMTAEWTHLEPGAREFKYYAPGVGLVLELSPSGGRTRVELVSIED